jgi:hypothetical protein
MTGHGPGAALDTAPRMTVGDPNVTEKSWAPVTRIGGGPTPIGWINSLRFPCLFPAGRIANMALN